MTKAEATDLAPYFSGVQGSSAEIQNSFAWGYPPIYQEIWYKFLLPSYYESYNCSIWNLGGPYRTPYPPPDDEWYEPRPDAQPGQQYPCRVTLYDSSDNVMAAGEHIQFTSQGRFNTWVYFKVEQPAPHFPDDIGLGSQNCKFRIERMVRGIITPGTIMVQGAEKIAVINTDTRQLYNYVFPELTGHSVGGGAGDVLLTGVNCIADAVASGISVRSRTYLAATTIPFTAGTVFYNITCNADRVNDFWISYTEAGSNRCRAVKILSEGQFDYSPVNIQLGPVLGITAVVDRLRARGDQVLYYVEQGSYEVKMWDIKNNVFIKTIAGNPGLGVVTDLLVVPGGDLIIGYNSATYPTTYTIRRVTGIEGIHVRDYVFQSNGIYNRINYTENNDHIMLWTHEQIGISTFRRVRLSDGAVLVSTNIKEYENNALVLSDDLYRFNSGFEWISIPQYTSQPNGPDSKYNFWVHPVYVRGNLPTTNGEGIMYVALGTQPPPDDEFYPPVFPPYVPPQLPPPGQIFPPDPGNQNPPPEIPPYPGYPWLPPPPPLPNDPPLNPPQVVPLPVKIGGGLILLDPQNASKTDSYQSTDGLTLHVPIKMNIRTAYLGD